MRQRIRQLSTLPFTVLFCGLQLFIFSSFAHECFINSLGEEECGDATEPLDCGVYMAPSTIDNANLGIFTAKRLLKDDVVPYPEIVIPLLFREWRQKDQKKQDGGLWDRYIWEGGVAGIESYTDTDRDDTRAVFIPGVGCTINSKLDLRNVKSARGSYYDASVSRDDPGAGSFSPYHGAETRVVADAIPAGSELFASYGDYWIPDLPGAKITFDEVMDEANDFLSNDFMSFLGNHARDMTTEMTEDLYQFTKDFPIKSPILTVLPDTTWTEVKHAIGRSEVNDTVRHFLRQESVRSLSWLQKHGYCQDHLRPGNSTISHAGKGAFATRYLPKGTVVGFAPLVHVGKNGPNLLRVPETQKYDLIINYSFTHMNSSVVLTPYGAMVNYINHDNISPNVRVRWPRADIGLYKADWLSKNTSFLANTIEEIGLAFEYVAIKDITEGEEVTMDYGPNWQNAWDEHVRNWQPPNDSQEYVHSSHIREEFFRTHDEQQATPYPKNLVTMCFRSFRVENNTFYYIQPLRLVPERVYCNVMNRYTADDGTTLYLVAMKISDEPEQWVLVNHVAHEGIFLYDKAKSNDWHLSEAFRYPIELPEEILPSSWQFA